MNRAQQLVIAIKFVQYHIENSTSIRKENMNESDLIHKHSKS